MWYCWMRSPVPWGHFRRAWVPTFAVNTGEGGGGIGGEGGRAAKGGGGEKRVVR